MLVPYIIGIVLLMDVFFVIFTNRPKILNFMKNREILNKRKFKLLYIINSLIFIMIFLLIPYLFNRIGIFYSYIVLFIMIIFFTIIQNYILETYTQ